MARNDRSSTKPPGMCVGDACRNQATRKCDLCNVPLCYACSVMDSHVCARPQRRPRKPLVMQMGAAAALAALQDAAERGTSGVGSWTLHAESNVDTRWTWTCGCGIGGGWIGASYTLVLAVATFANRHSRCRFAMERVDDLDTSPVRVVAGTA